MEAFKALGGAPNILLFLGFCLIIVELSIGGATMFFLALTGLIFILTAIAMSITGVTNLTMAVSFLSCITLTVFFSLYIWGKKNVKEETRTMHDDNYVGEKFFLNEDLSCRGLIKGVRVFGLDWVIVSDSDTNISKNTEVIVVATEFGKLIIKKVN